MKVVKTGFLTTEKTELFKSDSAETIIVQLDNEIPVTTNILCDSFSDIVLLAEGYPGAVNQRELKIQANQNSIIYGWASKNNIASYKIII